MLPRPYHMMYNEDRQGKKILSCKINDLYITSHLQTFFYLLLPIPIKFVRIIALILIVVIFEPRHDPVEAGTDYIFHDDRNQSIVRDGVECRYQGRMIFISLTDFCFLVKGNIDLHFIKITGCAPSDSSQMHVRTHHILPGRASHPLSNQFCRMHCHCHVYY